MQYTITGGTMPVLHINLDRDESIVAESGEFTWMSDHIAMRTSTQAAGGGGLFGALVRVVSGGTLFMTEYIAQGAPGEVAFAARIPGTIEAVDLDGQHALMVHRHGFVCATREVQLTMGFQQKLGAGLLGGDGLILQKLQGRGKAFIELGGASVMRTLAAGETIRAHPNHVGMFDASVNFSITTISGIKNAFFAGDGIFQARLTGPGRIWLQSMTVPRMAHALAPYLVGNKN